jgi:hypothetical protein
MTLRSIPLYVAPILAFAVIGASILWAYAPPTDRTPSESIGFLALLCLVVCASTAANLYQRREIPDLRIPFFLNAAGLGVLLVWLVLCLSAGLWHSVISHGLH